MNGKRIVKIETNPFRKPRQKFRLRVPKTTSNGVPVVNQSKQVQYQDIEPTNLTRIPGTATTLSAGRKSNGELNTGLDMMVANPYQNEEVFKVAWAERIIKGKPKVKLQHLLEYKHGVPYDFYTSRVEMSPKASTDEKVFFEKSESRIVLKDNTCFLDLDNPIDEVRYYVLKAHPSVANSYSELEDGSNINAEWYIVDETEKENIKATKIERDIQAGAALSTLSKSHDKTEALFVFCKALELDEAGAVGLSKDVALRVLFEYHSQNEDSYDKFMEMYGMWSEPLTRPFVICAAELYDLIRIGIVNYRAGKYSWVRPATEGKSSETYMRTSKGDFINNFMLDEHYADEVEFMRETYRMKTT